MLVRSGQLGSGKAVPHPTVTRTLFPATAARFPTSSAAKQTITHLTGSSGGGRVTQHSLFPYLKARFPTATAATQTISSAAARAKAAQAKVNQAITKAYSQPYTYHAPTKPTTVATQITRAASTTGGSVPSIGSQVTSPAPAISKILHQIPTVPPAITVPGNQPIPGVPPVIQPLVTQPQLPTPGGGGGSSGGTTPSTTAAPTSGMSIWVWVILGAGLLLGGGIWWFRYRHKKKAAAKGEHKPEHKGEHGGHSTIAEHKEAESHEAHQEPEHHEEHHQAAA